MPRYKPSDDGTVVDGSIVVYMRGPQSTVLVERSGRAALARATVASLVAAAETGVALCEECDRARRELESKRVEPAGAAAEGTIAINLYVEDDEGQGHASRPYEIRAGSKTISGTTASDGMKIPKVDQAVLIISGEQGKQTITLQFGDLQPAGTVQGAQERLQSLGYDVAPSGEVDDRTRKAIRAFQLAHKLGETAELDTATSRRIDLAYKGL